MSYQGFASFTASMPSGESLTSAIQLGNAWTNVYALIPSFSTNATVEIFGSNDGVLYNRVMHPSINSSTVTTNPYLISAAVTGWVKIPAEFPYIKLHATAAVNNGATFKVICS